MKGLKNDKPNAVKGLGWAVATNFSHSNQKQVHSARAATQEEGAEAVRRDIQTANAPRAILQVT